MAFGGRDRWVGGRAGLAEREVAVEGAAKAPLVRQLHVVDEIVVRDYPARWKLLEGRRRRWRRRRRRRRKKMKRVAGGEEQEREGEEGENDEKIEHEKETVEEAAAAEKEEEQQEQEGREGAGRTG